MPLEKKRDNGWATLEEKMNAYNDRSRRVLWVSSWIYNGTVVRKIILEL